MKTLSIPSCLEKLKVSTFMIAGRKKTPIHIYNKIHYEVYLIALNRRKTDNFQFSESPIPASGLVRLRERRLLRFLQRRRAASVFPPFHTSGGDSGKGVSEGERGEYRVASGVGSRVLLAWKSGDDVAMFRALLRAMI